MSVKAEPSRAKPEIIKYLETGFSDAGDTSLILGVRRWQTAVESQGSVFYKPRGMG